MKFSQRLAIGYIQTKFKLLPLFSKRKTAEKAFDLFCTPYLKSKAHTPPVFEQAEKLYLIVNGLKVAGWRWNHPQAKKALILHGFGSAAHKFHHFVTPLINKGYEVLAFDAPAHGSSAGKRVNAIMYSQMIELVNEKFGPVDCYIAHSFGGIALSLALEKNPPLHMPKIILLAPATETLTAVNQAFKMLKLKDEEVQKEFHNIIYEISGYNTQWFSIRRAIKNFTADILWIHDEDDDITPLEDAIKVKADKHPHVKFVITKGLGHRKIYRDAAVKKIIFEFA